MNTSLKTCEERDVKGLYKKARAGIIKGALFVVCVWGIHVVCMGGMCVCV